MNPGTSDPHSSKTFDHRDPNLSVTAIVTFYKGQQFIDTTLRSILSQTVPPLELLLIDDGSPTPPQLAPDLQDRVTVIRTQNQGAAAARNFGVSQAKGRWVAFCDQDDIWLPTKIEKQLQLAAEVPGLHCVLTDFAPTTDGVTPLRSHLSYAPQDFWSREEHPSGFVVREPIAGKLSTFQPSITSAPIALKDFYLQCGGFDVEVEWGAEDTCYHFRCLSVTPFGVVPEVLMLYRRHPAQGSADDLVQLRRTVDVWEHIATKYPEAQPFRNDLLAGLHAVRQEIRDCERYARRQKLKRLLRIG